ncbi:hypothetical protein [Amycolatopsis sp. NPDC049159]|uniref:hypothetical protein n=1 Tax=Amycolatopsis sp. NPDC049159 TaxID=3157210 RepID=UPI0034014425
MHAEITEVLDGGLVRFASPLGTANAAWRGTEPPRVGRVHVELDFPAALRTWAVVPAGTPELRGTGDQVRVTARVAAYTPEDGVLTLELGDSVVLAELPAPAPEIRPGGWLRVTAGRLDLYPVDL